MESIESFLFAHTLYNLRIASVFLQHMQLDDRIDNLVGSALFADGSGALIIGAVPRSGERPLFEMQRNASVIIPKTLEMMDW